jgi:hypothetical protein
MSCQIEPFRFALSLQVGQNHPGELFKEALRCTSLVAGFAALLADRKYFPANYATPRALGRVSARMKFLVVSILASTLRL